MVGLEAEIVEPFVGEEVDKAGDELRQAGAIDERVDSRADLHPSASASGADAAASRHAPRTWAMAGIAASWAACGIAAMHAVIRAR